MMRCISGWFLATAWAMCCSRMVLPVRGGATIRPRWPLPMGVSRSMTRVVSGSAPVSRRICSCGSIGVSSSKLRVRILVRGAGPRCWSTRARRGPLPLRAGFSRAGEQQAFAQAELAGSSGAGDVGIGRLGDVVPGRVAEEAVALGMHFEDALDGWAVCRS